jgi:hypothetical protein
VTRGDSNRASRQMEMAPGSRSHQLNPWCSSLSLLVFDESDGRCQVTWGGYLYIFSPEKLLHRNGVDPGGFEPASAALIESCATVTPRARTGVSGWASPLKPLTFVSARITAVNRCATQKPRRRRPWCPPFKNHERGPASVVVAHAVKDHQRWASPQPRFEVTERLGQPPKGWASPQ